MYPEDIIAQLKASLNKKEKEREKQKEKEKDKGKEKGKEKEATVNGSFDTFSLFTMTESLPQDFNAILVHGTLLMVLISIVSY